MLLLSIEMREGLKLKSFLVREEQKDCSAKPDATCPDEGSDKLGHAQKMK